MRKRYYIPKRYKFSLRLDKKTVWTEQELLQLPPTKFAEVIEKLGVEYTFFKYSSTEKYGATTSEEVYRAQRGDEKIRNKIISDSIGLLIATLNSLLPTIGVQRNSDEWEEYIQLGRIALDRAINTFDETKGAFSTWATTVVRNEYISRWSLTQKQKEKEVSLSTPIGMTEEGETKTLEDILEDPKARIEDFRLAQNIEEIKRMLSPVAWEIFKGKMSEMPTEEIVEILKGKGLKTQRGTEYTIYNISEILHNTVKPVLEKVFGRKIGSTTVFAEGEIDLTGVESLIARLRELVLESAKTEV